MSTSASKTTAAETVLYLREDENSSDVQEVRQFGSLTLEQLNQEHGLNISSVLECSADGTVFSRTMVVSEPSAVLHTGRHYIVRRHHRPTLLQQRPSTFANSLKTTEEAAVGTKRARSSSNDSSSSNALREEKKRKEEQQQMSGPAATVAPQPKTVFFHSKLKEVEYHPHDEVLKTPKRRKDEKDGASAKSSNNSSANKWLLESPQLVFHDFDLEEEEEAGRQHHQEVKQEEDDPYSTAGPPPPPTMMNKSKTLLSDANKKVMVPLINTDDDHLASDNNAAKELTQQQQQQQQQQQKQTLCANESADKTTCAVVERYYVRVGDLYGIQTNCALHGYENTHAPIERIWDRDVEPLLNTDYQFWQDELEGELETMTHELRELVDRADAQILDNYQWRGDRMRHEHHQDDRHHRPQEQKFSEPRVSIALLA